MPEFYKVSSWSVKETDGSLMVKGRENIWVEIDIEAGESSFAGLIP